jgi:glyoxylase-like metal-dependent hydrolase (beta-lactamase superfamily II)
VSFTRLGEGLYAYTAEGDPNTGVIIGDDGVMIVDAQATPAMAAGCDRQSPHGHRQADPLRAAQPLPCRARARRLGLRDAHAIIASDATRGKLIVERGEQDMASEIGRFPRLFQGKETIPGLTWPTLTFSGEISVWLGKREVRIAQPGRGHTAGDTIAYVPDAGVMFSGDLVEYKSACYCGDAHFKDWPKTLKKLAKYDPVALVPGRGMRWSASRMSPPPSPARPTS